MTCAWQEYLSILPPMLRTEVDRLYKDTLQELRLRLGQQPQLLTGRGRVSLGPTVGIDDLNFVVNTACRYSPWTASGASFGYITAPGGHRIGLCGEAVVLDGSMQGIRSLRSLNLRVARDFPGIAKEVAHIPGNILILGSPGTGKTTLLRDLIRQLSEKETVGVADERGELFPVGMDTGKATDILSGCPKAQALDRLVRTMSPDTVAVDEITAREDAQALLRCGWCGVRLLATAHAASREDLLSRNVYRPLVETRLFDTVVILHRNKSFRTERMTYDR